MTYSVKQASIWFSGVTDGTQVKQDGNLWRMVDVL